MIHEFVCLIRKTVEIVSEQIEGLVQNYCNNLILYKELQ